MAKKKRYFTQAEKMYKKADRLYAEGWDRDYYATMDNRDVLYDQDMIKEDHSKLANMPQEAKVVPWGSKEAGLNVSWADGGKGANRQISQLSRQIKKLMVKP